ncbi:MAG: ferrochelatase, partial [Ignavibacterium sp.]|nr:ferrochelatase [Ignavibacterium sp.]MDW8375772.1 ferrochelatase [Ignavibacteriales bacterium]
LRFFLVNFIIVPFRAPKSAKLYEMLWTEEGSPIMIYSQSLKNKLQIALGDKFEVYLAMRYQNPSLDNVLEEIRKKNFSRLLIVPLFPQYASATTGSVYQKVMKIIKNWWVIPEIIFVNEFFENEKYIETIFEISKNYKLENYDHILFSYHGLPNRQVDKSHIDGRSCINCECEKTFKDEFRLCYKASCYQTTRLIANKIGIPQNKYTVCFQSRLDKDWLEPFSDEVLINLAKNGAKKILVFSPAFVADCLETIIEIGHEYQKIFTENGGEKVDLVESLNDHPMWVETLKEIILRYS